MAEVEVYQLRVYLRQISPMIWWRLLVRSDSTIEDLHYTLQIAMSWTDYHLHHFRIRGRCYGISRIHGPSFRDQAQDVSLNSFQLRLRERFLYEYDFIDRGSMRFVLKKCSLLIQPRLIHYVRVVQKQHHLKIVVARDAS